MPKNKIIITSTPKGVNWFYDEYIKQMVRVERLLKIKKLLSKNK